MSDRKQKNRRWNNTIDQSVTTVKNTTTVNTHPSPPHSATTPPTPPSTTITSIPPRLKQHNRLLPKPYVIYQDNHLLVLYKPPGWHSIPNQTTTTGNNNNTTTTTTTTTNNSKCLLTYCQLQKYGGGTLQQYIKPIHRIDQPCSGIILYGKTTKVASRIQSTFMSMSRCNNSCSHHHHHNSNNSTNSNTANLVDVDDPMMSNDAILMTTNHQTQNDDTNYPITATNIDMSSLKKKKKKARKNDNTKQPSPKIIQKIYYVMVHLRDHHNHNNHNDDNDDHVRHNQRQPQPHDPNSSNTSSNIIGQWHTLQTIQLPSSSLSNRYKNNNNNNNNNNKGWSVRMIPPPTTVQQQQQQQNHQQNHQQKESTKEKLCTLQYRTVMTYPYDPDHLHSFNTTKRQLDGNDNHSHQNNINTHNKNDDTTGLRLLQIRTYQGTRHMIRAILACYNMPVVGDVRYGGNQHPHHHYHHSSTNTTTTSPARVAVVPPLPDASVALHAYSIRLHKSIIDKTKKKRKDVVVDNDDCSTSTTTTTIKDDNNNDQYHYWKVNIPKNWETYFQCTQSMIDTWEERYPIIE